MNGAPIGHAFILGFLRSPKAPVCHKLVPHVHDAIPAQFESKQLLLTLGVVRCNHGVVAEGDASNYGLGCSLSFAVKAFAMWQ